VVLKNRGFSLIEVMITMAVMATVSLALGNMFIEQIKTTAYLEDQLYKIQLSRLVESTILNSNACGYSLTPFTLGPHGPSSPEIILPVLKDNTNLTAISSNSDYEKIRIGQMTIKNLSVTAPNSTGEVLITVPIQRQPQRKGGGPSYFKAFTTKVYVTVNGAKTITHCSSEGSIVEFPTCTGVHSVCPLGPTTDYKYCFLTTVGGSEDDMDGFRCSIVKEGGLFVIKNEDPPGGGDVSNMWCAASCIKN
jgi:prepilin-type N-terminal cleavage/methylation domain-containing protein